MNNTALIARRVSKGNNEQDSSKLLADILDRHHGDNLASALVYNGFATNGQALRFAGVE